MFKIAEIVDKIYHEFVDNCDSIYHDFNVNMTDPKVARVCDWVPKILTAIVVFIAIYIIFKVIKAIIKTIIKHFNEPLSKRKRLERAEKKRKKSALKAKSAKRKLKKSRSREARKSMKIRSSHAKSRSGKFSVFQFLRNLLENISYRLKKAFQKRDVTDANQRAFQQGYVDDANQNTFQKRDAGDVNQTAFRKRGAIYSGQKIFQKRNEAANIKHNEDADEFSLFGKKAQADNKNTDNEETVFFSVPSSDSESLDKTKCFNISGHNSASAYSASETQENMAVQNPAFLNELRNYDKIKAEDDFNEQDIIDTESIETFEDCDSVYRSAPVDWQSMDEIEVDDLVSCNAENDISHGISNDTDIDQFNSNLDQSDSNFDDVYHDEVIRAKVRIIKKSIKSANM